MKRAILFLGMLLSATVAHALSGNGLDHPESAVFDTQTSSYYISSMNGDPTLRDANGYISQISADGLIVVLKFIDSKPDKAPLHAPKGMLIQNGTLYVVDLDGVYGYDLVSGQRTVTFDLTKFEPALLNDITADENGRLYVSDMIKNQIFILETKDDQHAPKIFISNVRLGQPNGLFFDTHTKNLYVATWETGEVLSVNPRGEVEVLQHGFQNLDGIFIDKKGDLYFSSMATGTIYRADNRGKSRAVVFQESLGSPADISYNPVKDEILVPIMQDGQVTSYSLNS